MDKLVEREAAARNPLTAAPSIAVQFFIIPLFVVGATVLVYVGFRSLLTEDRSAQEYLSDIQSGGSNRRWPAAYELSRLMGDPQFVKKEEATLAPQLVKAFAASNDDDPRVRQYLALALGRLTPPIPANARYLLIERMYESGDGGVRKMTVYALGSLPGDVGTATLVKALDDAEPDVQWNAAVALARHGRHEGVNVLRRMLDRDYVQRAVTRQQQVTDDIDPVGEVMITGLRAIAALKESSLSEPVKALSQADKNLKVREAATETLRTING